MLMRVPYPFFLLYGFVFTSIGVAIGMKAIAGGHPILPRRAMAILSGATVAHGFSEWSMLCSAIELRLGRPAAILALNLSIVLMSLGFLGFGSFGVETLVAARRARSWLRTVPLLLFGSLWLETLVAHHAGEVPWQVAVRTHVLFRYALGLPCVLLGAWGLFEISRSDSVEDHSALRRGFRRAAWSFVVYALIVGTRINPTVAPDLALASTPLRVITGMAVGWFLLKGLIIEAARERERIARMREEFIGIVAHDLRNPIGSITMNAELLDRMPENHSNQAVARIRRNSNLLGRLADDLLDASNIESRRVALRRRPANLASVVELAIEASGATKSHAVRVDGSYPKPIVIDADRITQVMVNLLSNAAKYSPVGTEIVVALAAHPDCALISVSNVGFISVSDQRQLFHRFFRSPAAVERGSPGHGLGLYIVRGLIEAHGGKVSVHSTANGRVVFETWLPNSGSAQEIAETNQPRSRRFMSWWTGRASQGRTTHLG